MTDDEIEELKEAGLDPPQDVSDLDAAEIKAIAERKELEAKTSTSELRAFADKIRTVQNTDRYPADLNPDEIRARMEQEETKIKEGQEKRERRRKIDQAARAERWKKAVPKAWRHANVDALPSGLRDLANNWIGDLADDPKNLIMTGPTGSGKTFTSYAIYQALYVDRYHVELIHISEMLDKIRDASNQNAELEKYKKPNCLILDDFGSEKRNEWVNERLALLFDYRWQWELPTVITTNVPASGFYDVFGDRITSRLLSKVTVYNITGTDRRVG